MTDAEANGTHSWADEPEPEASQPAALCNGSSSNGGVGGGVGGGRGGSERDRRGGQGTGTGPAGTADASRAGGPARGTVTDIIGGICPLVNQNAEAVTPFTDVREVQRELKARGVEFGAAAGNGSSGPAGFMGMEPDGHPGSGDRPPGNRRSTRTSRLKPVSRNRRSSNSINPPSMSMWGIMLRRQDELRGLNPA